MAAARTQEGSSRCRWRAAWRSSGRELFEDPALGFDGEEDGDEAADEGYGCEHREDEADAVVVDDPTDQDGSDSGACPEPGAAESSADVADTAPSAVRMTSGTVAARNATVYQRLRPTRSIRRAQRTDATTPAAEVTQPYARLVCRGRLNVCL